MNVYVPKGYQDFSCLMGACRHSCCRGWEIDIDTDTLEKYQAMPGKLGNRIRENMDLSGDTPCFRLDGEENCPFLRKDGLCDLILEGGEELLCQICADHPRFRNFYENRIEMGLGLCCEGAGKMLLSRQEKAGWMLLEGKVSENDLSPEEADFFAFRQEIYDVIQDRSEKLEERMLRLLPEDALSDYLPVLIHLEYMAEDLPRMLSDLSKNPDLWQNASLPEWLQIPMEQLLFYLISRHLPPALQDGLEEARLRFCLLMQRLISALCALRLGRGQQMEIEDFVEICRLFSGEIEYSQENMDALLEALLV